MHELSIARALIAALEPHVPAQSRVTKVRVVVGASTGIAPDALRWAFDAAVVDTALRGAELEIERGRSGWRCRACGAELESEGLREACRDCGGLGAELLPGAELELKNIEVVDV